MIIPPGAPKYTIGSICLANCTENVCYNNCCLYILAVVDNNYILTP